jgi:hypothetical protein
MAEQISQRVEQTTIPDYARPFVEDLLGSAQALTSPTNEYMQYQGDRIAQYSPMQQQAFENAALLTSAPQIRDATAMAGSAGLGALNTSFTYNPYQARSFADQTKNAAGQTLSQQYMSPYMQNVVDVQSQQARRQADIAQQTQQAQAARSGAFGGGRDAVMRSLGNAELQRNLANIQATGSQNAFQQAMQQFNAEQGANQAAANLNAQQGQFGAGLGLQGLQTALQGAQQLGNLGQTQFGQNRDVINLQNQFGGQQQQQAQNILNNQYQDFLNYQNYPYKQLGFMSDMLRGLPLTQQSATMYQPGPSTSSQLLGAGTSLAGAYLMGGRKEGGMVSSYAKGGSVNSRPAGLAELALSRMA